MRVKKSHKAEPDKTPVVRIMLVDDHPMMREGVRSMLRSEPDLAVCAEASTAPEALEKAVQDPPDLVLADLSLPGGSGLDLVRDLQIRVPQTRILVVSMHEESLFAERSLRAGARGYLMKQAPPERMVEAIRTVLRGDLYVSPDVADSLLNTFVGGTKRRTDRVGVERLSDREMQVFEGIGSGKTTRELAKDMRLSIKTIETYRANIKQKLGLANGTGLVHAAIHWVQQECGARGSEAIG